MPRPYPPGAGPVKARIPGLSRADAARRPRPGPPRPGCHDGNWPGGKGAKQNDPTWHPQGGRVNGSEGLRRTYRETVIACGDMVVASDLDTQLRQASRPRWGAPGAGPGDVPAARRDDHPARPRPQARDPHPHLHRVDRCPPGLPRGRPRRPLWHEYRGLLSLHPRRGGHRDRVGRAGGRLGEGAKRVGGAVDHVRTRLPMPWSAWSATMAPSSSTARCSIPVAATASPLPAVAPGRRTTARM